MISVAPQDMWPNTREETDPGGGTGSVEALHKLGLSAAVGSSVRCSGCGCTKGLSANYCSSVCEVLWLWLNKGSVCYCSSVCEVLWLWLNKVPND